jgi:hypothetical protein
MVASGRALLALIALIVAGCAAPDLMPPRPAGTAAAPAPSAAPIATPRSSVVALQTTTGAVLFVDPAGRTVTQLGVGLPLAWAAAAGQLWYVDQARHLRAVGIDGRVSDLGLLTGMSTPGASAQGLAVSGDGRRWAWGEAVGARARVYVGGIDAAAKIVLDEQTSNPVLRPLAFTPRGIVVVRSATGFGGCCYAPPELGVRDVLLVDQASLRVSQTWTACPMASPSSLGSFACTGAVLTVHPPDGSTRTVTPIGPVVQAAWAHVDDQAGRVVFGVIHARGRGDGGCPCQIDTEQAGLDGGAATRIADQLLPEDILPDGRIVAASAPALPAQAPPSRWLLSPGGARSPLGPDGALFLAVVTIP